MERYRCLIIPFNTFVYLFLKSHKLINIFCLHHFEPGFIAYNQELWQIYEVNTAYWYSALHPLFCNLPCTNKAGDPKTTFLRFLCRFVPVRLCQWEPSLEEGGRKERVTLLLAGPLQEEIQEQWLHPSKQGGCYSSISNTDSSCISTQCRFVGSTSLFFGKYLFCLLFL